MEVQELISKEDYIKSVKEFYKDGKIDGTLLFSYYTLCGGICKDFNLFIQLIKQWDLKKAVESMFDEIDEKYNLLYIKDKEGKLITVVS